MSISIQRSIIEKFNFNGKVIRSVHVKGTGECLVARDVYKAVGYDDDNNGRRAVRTHVPEEYKMRVKDALSELGKQVEHARQLEFSNTGLQGEIRAKDQEIDRRRVEVQDLIANRHVPRRQGKDNVLCFVDKKKR